MGGNNLRSVVCLTLLFVCGLLSALAQRTATLVGTVVDPSQAVVTGAKITATHLETNQKFTTTSNSSGDYALPALPEGQYAISAEAPGFNVLTKNGIVLVVGQSLRIEFSLTVGADTQMAQVSEQSPLLETTNASIAQAITPQMVEALPLNQRDIVALATLAPGVLPPRGQVAGGNMANGGFIVLGRRRRSDNVIFLNGAMITQGNGADTFLPNVDAIKEFQIKSGLYEAKYGIMDGGQLVVVTKSTRLSPQIVPWARQILVLSFGRKSEHGPVCALVWGGAD